MTSNNSRTSVLPSLEDDFEKRSDYVFGTLGVAALVLAWDVLFYGEVLPLLGLYIGSNVSALLEFPYYAELLMVACCTIGLFFLVLGAKVEKPFWVKLYSLDPTYRYILHGRDALNILTLGTYIASKLMQTTVITIKNTGYAPSPSDRIQRATTGISAVLCNRVEAYGLDRIVSSCENPEGSSVCQEVMWETSVLFLTAKIMSAVGRLLYFNTLGTYLQTLRIIRDFQMAFNQAYEETQAGQRHQRRRRRRNRGSEVPAPVSDTPGDTEQFTEPTQDSASEVTHTS